MDPTTNPLANYLPLAAVLLIPGLSDAGITQAAQVTSAAQIYCLTLDPAHVEKGAAVGVTRKDARAQVVLNLGAARQVNAMFEPAVLKLARIIQ